MGSCSSSTVAEDSERARKLDWLALSSCSGSVKIDKKQVFFLYICTVYWTWQIFSSNMKTIEMKRCGL